MKFGFSRRQAPYVVALSAVSCVLLLFSLLVATGTVYAAQRRALSTTQCWVGSPPPGFNSATRTVSIRNFKDQPAGVRVDGLTITVYRRGGGRNAVWKRASVTVDGRTETALFPGEACYMQLEHKGEIAKRTGWRITLKQFAFAGERGRWTDGGSSHRYTAPLTDDGLSHTDTVYQRGEWPLTVTFDRRDGWN